MDRSIVILQPQYTPWIGVFEQIKLADIYVHYDDVQYPQGRSFTNRVQVKTVGGQKWITVPVSGSGCNINKTQIDYSQNWQHKHKELLRHTYCKAPYYQEMMLLVEDILSDSYSSIADLNMYALELISDYFGLKTIFKKSSDLNIVTSSTDRLVDICKHYDANKYITGLGAKNYIDYKKFENSSIDLHYMDYKNKEYAQINGEFIPYVTILDLIANCGKDGVNNICSGSKFWKDVPDLKDRL